MSKYPEGEAPKLSTDCKIVSACQVIENTPVGETHKLAASLYRLGGAFHDQVRVEARYAFWGALIAAGLGTVFYLSAAWSLMHDKAQPALYTLIGGTLTQVLAGGFLYIYRQASSQMVIFHGCLEKTSGFLLANSLCENMGELRDSARRDLMALVTS